MDVRQITSELSVTPQITPEDVALAAKMGFRTLIDNRPDGEAGSDLDSTVMARAAEEAGLAFHYLPYTPGELTAELSEAFNAAYAAAEKPVLAYCRSGTRSSHLWALSQAETRPVPEIVELAARAGYDHSGLVALLESLATTR
ncbi:TIGR01244 family sulfur transferase [Paenirhodobacter populi]|uniref:TIGR01244 family phosphatase n=1 Tax=Paenirhodobacter populi TaxID=2306993 RepID=A0A443K287_9RHOB|nr:TIGR01244 family sulfur transferase [Sinirhodobacter populi]RWR04505.1 TIGR01244 family phosphatase [Sinirhodobacter populi]RWR13086.1 TIGR01244 family phosphatase [Sinirhodobacter populi]RWR17393.1 TIGR01244 family phosphatase [Sinirhodobacter populi]RWR26878.1 TIGR01244 family phosphatase [Sinirhodobacter populi]RWR34216.1 TIGR01244 family phosphatase [Sinirhodobacter populi]